MMGPRSSVLLMVLAALGAPAPSARAQEGGVRIVAQYQEVHRILDDSYRPIVWTYNLSFVLSGENKIHEEWQNSNNSGLTVSTSSDSQFGDEAHPYVWHILGRRKLVRIVEFRQHSMTMIFNIGADNRCKLDVLFKLKPGFTDMYVPRADTHEMAHFTLPRTLGASCTIS